MNFWLNFARYKKKLVGFVQLEQCFFFFFFFGEGGGAIFNSVETPPKKKKKPHYYCIKVFFGKKNAKVVIF
jgi:hypothetical protein